jgi:hypothetical protein
MTWKDRAQQAAAQDTAQRQEAARRAQWDDEDWQRQHTAAAITHMAAEITTVIIVMVGLVGVGFLLGALLV